MPSQGGFSSGAEVVQVAIVLFGLISGVFFLRTLPKALKRCAPENQKMAPGRVWLLLIPLFNIVWIFIVVKNITKSLDAEFKKRGITDEPEPAENLGLAYAILSICTVIPGINILAFLPASVCWIMYWSKIASYSLKLQISDIQ